MGKNVILPEQTVRDLLEAYASLSAWYYQLWGALRSGSPSTESPNEQMRVAFLARLAHDYPELAALAKDIPSPRQFVPPPVVIPKAGAVASFGPPGGEEPATLIEPAAARGREMGASEPPGGIAPPPMVAPGTVKYNR